MKKGILVPLSALALALLFPAAPLRAAFLYVANPNVSVIGFSIDAATGALRQVPGSPFAIVPHAITADPTGKFVFVTQQININTSLSVYRIGSDGSLKFLASYPGGSGDQVAVDASGKFVYVTSVYNSSIWSYKIGSDGTLTATPNSPFPFATSPTFLAIEPVHDFIYVTFDIPQISPPGQPAKEEFILKAYSIGNDGSLTALPNLHFKPPKVPSETIGTDPNGQFLYGMINAHDVSGFKVSSAGDLKPIAHSLYSYGTGPIGLFVDRTGKFLYLSHFNKAQVLGYSIDTSSGALKPIPGSPFPAGIGPDTMGVDPSDNFLYVANADSSSISAYRINSGGALTALPGSPIALNPSAEPLNLTIVP